jgi:hypothetical protein
LARTLKFSKHAFVFWPEFRIIQFGFTHDLTKKLRAPRTRDVSRILSSMDFPSLTIPQLKDERRAGSGRA